MEFHFTLATFRKAVDNIYSLTVESGKHLQYILDCLQNISALNRNMLRSDLHSMSLDYYSVTSTAENLVKKTQISYQHLSRVANLVTQSALIPGEAVMEFYLELNDLVCSLRRIIDAHEKSINLFDLLVSKYSQQTEHEKTNLSGGGTLPGIEEEKIMQKLMYPIRRNLMSIIVSQPATMVGVFTSKVSSLCKRYSSASHEALELGATAANKTGAESVDVGQVGNMPIANKVHSQAGYVESAVEAMEENNQKLEITNNKSMVVLLQENTESKFQKFKQHQDIIIAKAKCNLDDVEDFLEIINEEMPKNKGTYSDISRHDFKIVMDKVEQRQGNKNEPMNSDHKQK